MLNTLRGRHACAPSHIPGPMHFSHSALLSFVIDNKPMIVRRVFCQPLEQTGKPEESVLGTTDVQPHWNGGGNIGTHYFQLVSEVGGSLLGVSH